MPKHTKLVEIDAFARPAGRDRSDSVAIAAGGINTAIVEAGLDPDNADDLKAIADAMSNGGDAGDAQDLEDDELELDGLATCDSCGAPVDSNGDYDANDSGAGDDSADGDDKDDDTSDQDPDNKGVNEHGCAWFIDPRSGRRAYGRPPAGARLTESGRTKRGRNREGGSRLIKI